ncbi:outer membrane protein assembly factor BamB family protein [Halopiger goleimassiliensis]|uniref:outer membrane protein assembly factor BamB family protein n=1 Tax=Halopiger goleimassiliensis TaxID=1293048 RepID=UPI0009DB966E|nr:PQQ-binding-like beta-propeller repeat protein [Halopiger goleimassiliensis]
MGENRRTRRQWLVACAGTTVGMAALAGCTSGSDGNGTSPEDDPGAVADDGEYGAWPMIRYNSRNRLSVPHDGIDGEPEIEWTADLEGTVEPPVVYDDTAFVSHRSGMYSAVDLSDGEVIWEDETGEQKALAVSESAVFTGGDGLEARDHETGDVQWTTGHEQSVRSIRIYDELIYAGLEDRLLVVDEDGEERNEFEVAETLQSIAIDADWIYVQSREESDEDEFTVAAYERDSGDHLWEHDLYKTETWIDDRYTRTFPVVDGEIYTRDENSLITIEGSSGEIDEIAEFEDTTLRNRPTVDNERIYCSLIAYDLDANEPVADWEPEASPDDPLVAAAGNLYGTHQAGVVSPQKFVSMEAETGELRGEKEIPEQTEWHSPVVLNGLVLVAVDDPGLIAFS